MVLFFRTDDSVIVVEANHQFSPEETRKLCWLFGNAAALTDDSLPGWFVGPRKEMITPWSTNAVEITQNMGLSGISRIEEFFPVGSDEAEYDKMLQRLYKGLDSRVFEISKHPDPIVHIDDIDLYNRQEGLALSDEEVEYLNGLSKKIGRKLTDSEVFGLSLIHI